MCKLYVRDVCVGEFTETMGAFELDLKQNIETNDYSILQVAYYLRDYADFFTIYSYYDKEDEFAEYIIDTNMIHPGYERFNAIELESGTETETIINLIKESIE